MPHIVGGNRDPKVVFCEERNEYIMALYFIWNDYGLLSSKNLTDWKLFQKITFPGEAECPDIFPIKDDQGNRKWVFMGANDKYLVGEFRDGRFTAVQEEISLHYGSGAYAGQTFANMPEERVVRICWDRWNCRSEKFNGQMGIPMELTLKNISGKSYLCANPVKELETLFLKQEVYERKAVSAGKEERIPLADAPYLIKIRGIYAEEGVLHFGFFGCEFSVDFSKNRILLGERQAPVSVEKHTLELTVLTDRCSMEIFADGGTAYLSAVEE